MLNLIKSKLIIRTCLVLVFSFSFSFLAIMSLDAFAADSLSYSGRLVNSNGSPVPGPVTIKAELAYTNAPSVILCSEEIPSVVLTKGVFHIKLDFSCSGGIPLTQVLAQTPAGESVAIRITDVTNSKTYPYQAMHSIPFSNLAEQLVQMGATNGQVLKWDGTKWAPGAAGLGSGSVTSVATGTGLTGGPITSTGTISIANSGVGTAEIANAAVTDAKIAAVAASKITGTINSTQILDGTIVNADINASAAIDYSKLNIPDTTIPFAKLNIADGAIPVAKINGLSGSLSALIEDAINDAVTTKAPSENAVYDALALKLNLSGGALSPGATITGLPALPLTGSEAASKDYVDSQVTTATTSASGKVSKAGDTMSGVLTLDSDLKIKGGSNYVTIKGHGTSATYNFILPQTAGASGEILRTDGAGNLSWINPSTIAPGAATVDSSSIVDGTIVDADISASAAIAQSKISGLTTALSGKQTTALADGKILVGNGSGAAAAVAVSGDVTLSNAGAVTLVNTAVTPSTYNSVTVDAKGRVTAGTNEASVKTLSVSAPLANSGTASDPIIGMPVATTTDNGYLSSANWNTFNSKQAAITAATSLNTGSVTTNLQDGIVINPYGASAGNTGEIRFNELVGSNYVAFKAPDVLAANTTYTLPSGDGSLGQVLSTNASGVLSWTTVATGGTTLVGDVGGTLSANTIGAGKVTSTHILDGTIVDADINASANITVTKLGTGAVDNTEFNYLDGVTSSIQTQFTNKQPLDATLTSLAAYNTNGILVQTAADTFTGRSIASTANRTVVTNGDGVAGNPTIDIDTSLLPSPIAGDAGKFLKASGANASAWTALSSSDITTALGFTPINKAGDSISSGTFALSGTAALTVQNPVNVLDAANKQYVDGFGQWTISGSDIYRSSGNVGIGTTSPQSLLHLASSATTGAAQRFSSTDTGGRTFALTSTGSGNTVAAGSFVLTDLNASAHRLVVDSSGNVGIGSTNPTAALEISRTDNQELMRLSSSSAPANFYMKITGVSNGTGDYKIQTTNNGTSYDAMYFKGTGNVGIGSTVPGSSLDVKGTLRLSGSTSGYVGFAPAATAGATTYTLPTTQGTSGQVLTTDGVATTPTLTWTTPTAAPVSSVFGRTGAVVSASGDYTATQITNTAAGNIAATTVQAALNELDSEKQPLDATLTSLATYNTNGILVQTAADTFTGRSIASTANRTSVTNGDGVAGNPTINIDTSLLPSPIAGDAGKFLKASGANASAWTALGSSDITTALGFTPINKAGDSISSGTFTLSGAAVLRTLDPIAGTDVANKQYVDGYGQWTKGASSSINYTAGNVGIGTTSPNAKLHVNGGIIADSITDNSSGNAFYITSASTTAGPGSIYMNDSEAKPIIEMAPIGTRTNYSWLRIDAGTDTQMPHIGSFANSTNPGLAIGPTTSTSLVINGAGNVGVGTSNPLSKLQVAGTVSLTNAGELWRSVYYNSGWIYTDSNVPAFALRTEGPNITNLTFGPGGTAGAAASMTGNIYLNGTTGNIGIGTTAPGAKLEVTSSTGAGIISNVPANSIALRGVSPSDIYVDLYNTAGTSGSKFFRIGNTSSTLQFQKVDDAYTTSTTLMTLLPSGNVGIGTKTSNLRLV